MREHDPPHVGRPDDDETLPLGAEPPRPITTAPEPAGRLRRLARRIGRALVLLLVGFYVVCMLLLVVYRFVDPPTTGVQLQRRVEALVTGDDYSRRREIVPLEAISPHLPHAVVAAEDGAFWDHSGFDFGQMRAALEEAVEGTRMRGASTITQQLVKNLFGCACRNPVRKVYDLTLTPPAELFLGKDRILEIYLNQVEWGDGIYGAEAAARHHYGVGADDLSRTQAAGLAALLPNPLERTPGNTGEYRGEILRRMRQRGW
jgi:monofunctional biosynthetic peptidoglycan transglycosylase